LRNSLREIISARLLNEMTETRRHGEGKTRRSAGKPCLGTSPCLLVSQSLCLITWLTLYAMLLAAVVWSLTTARHWALVELATPQSIGDWQAWRKDVREQQSQHRPVKRRVPKSAEPPALVLMRDYFATSLTGAIIFTTVLYWVIAWFVTGILAGHREPKEYVERVEK
jgi:hypothetical protein